MDRWDARDRVGKAVGKAGMRKGKETLAMGERARAGGQRQRCTQQAFTSEMLVPIGTLLLLHV